MSLVDLNILDTEDNVASSPSALFCGLETGDATGLYAAQSPEDIVTAAGEGRDVHFVTNGKWSMHDLFSCAMRLVPHPHLYFSTFSITEFPARILAQALADGSLKSLQILLDARAPKRYPAVHQLVQNIACKIRVMPVHAKVMILENKENSMVVMGSANWTENPRLETGMATINPMVATFYKSWLFKAIEHGDVFK